MADIAPFRGIRYNPARVGSLANVLAPPYDVLSAAEQAQLYERSPYNVVRIILNRREAGDPPNAPYQRAADTLQKWLDEGALIEEEQPAFYVYRQLFRCPITGAQRSRTGLVCALRLADYSEGVILPHEDTRPAPKADRLELLRATRANTESILALYEDSDGKVVGTLSGALASAELLANVTADGMTHQLYRVAAVGHREELPQLFREKQLWIADGHHRYETALTYRKELTEAGRAVPGADRLLVTLVAMEDAGLVVLPTHRVVGGISTTDLERTLDAVQPLFCMKRLESPEEAAARVAALTSSASTFAMVQRSRSLLFRLKDPAAMAARAPDRSPAWRALDVSVLQTLVLDRLQEMGLSGTVSYTQDAFEAVAHVMRGEASCAFLMARPSPEDVRQVTLHGDRMPPKSTFFHPKLWSGVLMRRLEL